MAETVTIEIPVTVEDTTSAGIQSTIKMLTAFEKSLQRMQQQMSRMELSPEIEVSASDHASDRIGEIVEEAENLDETDPNIEIDAIDDATGTLQGAADQAEEFDDISSDVDIGANDSASGKIMDVQDRVSEVDGETATVEAEANDAASGILSSVVDQVEVTDGDIAVVDVDANDAASSILMSVDDLTAEVDGQYALVEVEADDMASEAILDAADVLHAFDGMSGVAYAGVDDAATPVVRAAEDAVEEFSGSSGAAEITANDTASSIIDDVTDKAQEWGSSVWTGTLKVAGSALGLLGITTSISDTVSTYEDFESAMSQVEAISGTSGAALEDLTAKAKEMGATTKYTATEAAEAMNYMAMAGWESSDMLDGIEGIMNLAAASGEDLATTSDIVTDALTAFGLSASDSDHFADVLATAASSANTTVSGMGETFKYAGSMAGALGYSIEDVALATGLMANSGIKGSMAGTALNTIFTRLSTNTSGAADALEELGIDFYDSEGNARDLSDVLEELRVATADYTDEQLTALANTVAGTEAQKGLLAILNASEDDYNSLSDAINNADGSAADMADTMLDNLEGTLTLMNSAIDGVKTSLGERIAPYIEAVAEAITEAAPDIESGLMSIMDTVDQVAEDYQSKISEMTSSDAWQEADLFGKINIAWDTIIVEPFTDWITTDGASLMSDGIYTLFSEAVKILPGGDDAGITSWISAAILGKGAMTIASGASSIVTALEPVGATISNIAAAASSAGSVGEFVGTVSSMIPMAGKVGIAATAIVGSIALISSAIDDYNDKQLSSSLEEHFGNIELSAQEAADAAEALLHTDYMVNIELYLGEIENAEAFHEEAQAALKDNGILEWKSSILGIELTADEQTEYKENVSTFAESKIREIEDLPYAAYIGVSTFLTGEDGENLADAISNYALGDQLEMDALSEQLTAAVDSALSDGILSVDEEQHIQELQEKMNAITSKWAAAENQAELEWIKSEYGSMTASQLSSGGFEELVEALQSQRATNNAEVKEAYTSLVSTLSSMDEAGRLGEENGLLSYDDYVEMANQAVRNTKADELANTVLALESNTLTDTYGDKISENLASSESKSASQIADTESYFQQVQSEGENGNYALLADSIASGADAWNSGNGKWGELTTDSDQNALYELYQTMKPDVDEMQGIIDEYIEAGQQVPQAVMDAYNEVIETGAAAGDSDAAWQAYANDLIANGSDELVEALTDENNPMYENIRNQLPEELAKAIDRAAAETTTDPISLDEIEAELNGGEIEGMDEWLASIQEQLDEAGNLGTVEATADGEVTITVDEGDCLSQIGEILGVDWHDIAEANGLEDPYTIYPDMVLTIPMDNLEIESSEDGDVAGAITEEMQEQIGNALAAFETDGYTAELSAEYDVDLTLGEVAIDDGASWDSIAEAVGMTGEELAAANGMTIDTELTAGMTITIPKDQIDIDISSLSDAVQEEMESDESTAETEMESDVTVTGGEINTDDAVEDAQTEVDDAFDETYETQSSADVVYDQTNNASEVYEQASSELQEVFYTTIPVDASAVITIDYSIANPSASIQLSSGGTASATISASVAANATGGEVGLNGAELSWVGEEGLEYIIPTVPSRRGHGIDLWEQAGMALGVLDSDGTISAYANGGAVGNGPEVNAHSSIIPLSTGAEESGEWEVWSVTGEKLSGDSEVSGENAETTVSVVQSAGGGNVFNVSVDCSPLIQIDGEGMDEDKVFEVMRSRIREVADDLGDEFAEKLTKIFQNMPVTAEA